VSRRDEDLQTLIHQQEVAKKHCKYKALAAGSTRSRDLKFLQEGGRIGLPTRVSWPKAPESFEDDLKIDATRRAE